MENTDVRIFFNEPLHKYTDNLGNEYISTTTLLHAYQPKFNKAYWLEKKANELGISKKTLEKQWQTITDEACVRGSKVHGGLEDGIKGASQFAGAVKYLSQYKDEGEMITVYDIPTMNAEYKLLDKGKRLGRFISNYRQSFFEPDKRNQEIVFSYKPLPWAKKTIYKLIEDITISMKSIDHLKMPRLIINDYPVVLSEKEFEIYDAIRQNFVLEFEDKDITIANAGVLSSKLLQIANGGIYKNDGTFEWIHDKKLDALEDVIEASNGQPILVAYWFKSDLERIENRLKKIKDKTDISFEILDKPESIEKWNRGEISVGLIHPQSAGHGLNLQEGGNVLVWFSLTWSLELYQQTIGRLYRQGQKASSVVVIRIIGSGTIDEDVIKALDKKERTQDALIKAVKAHVKGGNRQ